MSVIPLLERLKASQVLVVSGVLALMNVMLNLLIPEQIRGWFNSLFELIASVIITLLLLLMWLTARKYNYAFSRIIKWMFISLLAWAVGDSIFLYYEIINKDAFYTIVDIIYIGATITGIIVVLKIPGSLPVSRRWNRIVLEISILVLSASVLFFVLLFVPGNPYLNYDLITLVLICIYPVLDIVFLWITLILYFSYIQRRIQKVLGVIIIGTAFLFSSDFFYLVNSLYDTMVADYVIDIGYYFFYIWMFIAGLYGFQEIRGTNSDAKKESSAFQKGNWIVFLPGIFLVIVISSVILLVLSNPSHLFNGIIILIGIIIFLFLIHQYLVIRENVKLTHEMKQINQELESTVEHRTAELIKTNAELKAEMLERRKTEGELAKTNLELDLLNQEKVKLFSILAHDLRSPLGAMMSLSNLMVESMKDFNEEELLDITNTLNKSATQTFKLLNDLLSWSTAQMGKSGEIKTSFPLHEIVTDNVAVLNLSAEKKQISIIADIAPELVVYADQYAIQTVIRNLLSNAIKFSFPKAIIKVEAIKEGDQVKISIIDTGVGISSETQKSLFHIDSVNSRKGTGGEKGSGFGLLLCKDIVEKNGGIIGFESEINKGTTFYFTVPVEPSLSSTGSKSIQTQTSSNYVIDLSQNIGITTLTGSFSVVELMTELSRVWQNKSYNPSFPTLVDLRKANFIFDFSDLSKFSDFFEAMPGNLLKRKFALLTTTPQQVAYSTVFKQSTMAKYPIIIEIFTTFSGAVSWLKS